MKQHHALARKFIDLAPVRENLFRNNHGFGTVNDGPALLPNSPGT